MAILFVISAWSWMNRADATTATKTFIKKPRVITKKTNRMSRVMVQNVDTPVRLSNASEEIIPILTHIMPNRHPQTPAFLSMLMKPLPLCLFAARIRYRSCLLVHIFPPRIALTMIAPTDLHKITTVTIVMINVSSILRVLLATPAVCSLTSCITYECKIQWMLFYRSDSSLVLSILSTAWKSLRAVLL